MSDPNTAYNHTECKNICTRRSVAEWTPEEWCLYSQLFNEMNRRGWLGDIDEIHTLSNFGTIDGLDASFHHTVAFLPWHRFYIAHFE